MRDWKTSPEAKNEFAVEGNIVWIKLTQGKEACVDLKDWEKVKGYRWFAWSSHNVFYARTNLPAPGGKQNPLLLHWAVSGVKGSDHRDLDGLNNRRENLRTASSFDNARNRGKIATNTSGFKGVSFHKGSGLFQSRVGVDNRLLYLGLYKTPEEAARAYDRAATEYFGQFARLNFPAACGENTQNKNTKLKEIHHHGQGLS